MSISKTYKNNPEQFTSEDVDSKSSRIDILLCRAAKIPYIIEEDGKIVELFDNPSSDNVIKETKTTH